MGGVTINIILRNQSESTNGASDRLTSINKRAQMLEEK